MGSGREGAGDSGSMYATGGVGEDILCGGTSVGLRKVGLCAAIAATGEAASSGGGGGGLGGDVWSWSCALRARKPPKASPGVEQYRVTRSTNCAGVERVWAV